MNPTATVTESMAGRLTDDPLRQAFSKKTEAHPRPTGMPLPAEQFHTQWGTLMDGQGEGKRAAYVHIPFCKTRCSYCCFYQNTAKKDEIQLYVDYLIQEIEMTSAAHFVQSAPIHAVYFGGGTPTELSAEQIHRLGKVIQKNLPLANDCEITFESRFKGLTDEKIDACIEAGFNRFSMGVQTFDSTIRRKMSRIDPQEVLLERLQKLAATDHLAVIVDLIFGLPFQTPQTWQRDLEIFTESGVDGVDLYQLILMGQSRMMQSIEKGTFPEPANTAEKATLFAEAVGYMQQQHFRQLSVCHWSRGSRERNIYNHLSKSGADIIPFGSGAGGSVAGYKMMQHRKLEDYFGAIEAKQKPITALIAPHVLHNAFAAVGSAFDLGYLDLNVMDRSGFSFSDHCQPLFETMVNNGLAERNGRFLDLTLAGQFWAVNLNQGIQEYLLSLPESHKQSHFPKERVHCPHHRHMQEEVATA